MMMMTMILVMMMIIVWVIPCKVIQDVEDFQEQNLRFLMVIEALTLFIHLRTLQKVQLHSCNFMQTMEMRLETLVNFSLI